MVNDLSCNSVNSTHCQPFQGGLRRSSQLIQSYKTHLSELDTNDKSQSYHHHQQKQQLRENQRFLGSTEPNYEDTWGFFLEDE